MPKPPAITLTTTDAYVAGGAVRLVTGGWPSIAGRDFAERVSGLSTSEDHLRVALLHEPRGHAAMTGAILVEPSDERAHAGVAFMHHSGWSAFCGVAAMGAAAIAWRRGLVQWPQGTPLRVETPAGVIEVRPDGDQDEQPGGAATWPVRLRATTPDAFLVRPALPLVVGTRTIAVDLAWCAGLYALTDAEFAGAPLDLSRAAELASQARLVRGALEAHALRGLPSGLRTLEAVVFVGADERGDADLQSATVYGDGVVDRAPGGGATAAVLAVLDAMGMLPGDRPLVHRGPRGALQARVVSRAPRPDQMPDLLRVELEGDVHLTGDHAFTLDPADPSVPWPARRPRSRRR